MANSHKEESSFFFFFPWEFNSNFCSINTAKLNAGKEFLDSGRIHQKEKISSVLCFISLTFMAEDAGSVLEGYFLDFQLGYNVFFSPNKYFSTCAKCYGW